MKVIIVGGVAGGASCAARLRRLDEKADILMVERGPYVSYANCGLPYHVGGLIPQEQGLLVANAQLFRAFYNFEARTNCEAISISHKEKTVDLRDVTTGEVTEGRSGRSGSPGPVPGATSEAPHRTRKRTRTVSERRDTLSHLRHSVYLHGMDTEEVAGRTHQS